MGERRLVVGRKREEEEWARLVLGKHLGRVAEMHDDGTQDSMCDLRVGTVEAPEIAIECVQDADPDAIRVWKKGPAGGPHQIETKGDWLVELSSSCQVAKLPRRLAPLLAILHSSGLLHMDLESTIQSTASHIARELVELGVTGVECINVNGNGRVHFTMSSPGGIVDPTGADLADWVSGLIASEKFADVRHKLNVSGATQRHVCVILETQRQLRAVLFCTISPLTAVQLRTPRSLPK